LILNRTAGSERSHHPTFRLPRLTNADLAWRTKPHSLVVFRGWLVGLCGGPLHCSDSRSSSGSNCSSVASIASINSKSIHSPKQCNVICAMVKNQHPSLPKSPPLKEIFQAPTRGNTTDPKTYAPSNMRKQRNPGRKQAHVETKKKKAVQIKRQKEIHTPQPLSAC